MVRAAFRNYLNNVFAIPLDGERYNYGHIIANGSGSDCYITYDIVAKEHPPLDEILNSPIVFFLFTLHQKLVSKEWPIVGNAPFKQSIQMPEYKVKTMVNGVSQYVVTKFDGEILRSANEFEIENLGYMESYTPNILENAVKARYGVMPWRDLFNDLLYINVLEKISSIPASQKKNFEH